MSNVSKIDALGDTVTALEELLDTLDESGGKCSSCGLVKRTNVTEFRQAQEIKGMLTRARHWLAIELSAEKEVSHE